MGGRGLHEKAIGELKTGLAFDAIPTDDYRANSVWQQFVVLAHNLLANFQIESGLIKRHRTRKNTARWALKSVRTLRFELFNRAGHLMHPEGRATLQQEGRKTVPENQRSSTKSRLIFAESRLTLWFQKIGAFNGTDCYIVTCGASEDRVSMLLTETRSNPLQEDTASEVQQTSCLGPFSQAR